MDVVLKTPKRAPWAVAAEHRPPGPSSQVGAAFLEADDRRFTASILAHGFPLGRAFPRTSAVAIAPSQPLTAAGLLRILTGFLAVIKTVCYFTIMLPVPAGKVNCFSCAASAIRVEDDARRKRSVFEGPSMLRRRINGRIDRSADRRQRVENRRRRITNCLFSALTSAENAHIIYLYQFASGARE